MLPGIAPPDPDRPVWLVGGTRPEALKLAPLADALDRGGRLRPLLVASGQHPVMFHQGLAAFGRAPDLTLCLDRTTGTLAELVAQLSTALDAVLADDPPAAVVVQGDTTTALVAALAAFWRDVPVVHLEAGLRSHDLAAPFPEEANRRLVAQVAALHLAPTGRAAANLTDAGVRGPEVIVTGNTVVDAVLAVAGAQRPAGEPALAAVLDDAARGSRRLALVTVHRRESWGEPLREVLGAVRDLLDAHPDLTVVLPMHPNPAVRRDVTAALGGHDRVRLTEPLDYPDLVAVLSRASIVLSDSGGIQEEAPSFGVPVLVLRDVSERMEAVEAGCALLLGTDRARIRSTADRLLTDRDARAAMVAAGNPFGDGRAADRAEEAIAWLLGLQDGRPADWQPGVPAARR